jgi:hypothetical protein
MNLIMYVFSHALGPTGQYSVLSFRISTVFDINPLELVRFYNSWYFVSSRSFSCPALSFSLLFSYFICKSRKQFMSFSTVSDRFHPKPGPRPRMQLYCLQRPGRRCHAPVDVAHAISAPRRPSHSLRAQPWAEPRPGHLGRWSGSSWLLQT